MVSSIRVPNLVRIGLVLSEIGPSYRISQAQEVMVNVRCDIMLGRTASYGRAGKAGDKHPLD